MGSESLDYKKGYDQGVKDFAERMKKYYKHLSGKTMPAVVKFVVTIIEQEMLNKVHKEDKGDGE